MGCHLWCGGIVKTNVRGGGPDVLNLQLDQRKLIVSEQFIEIGLIANNDGGGGDSKVQTQQQQQEEHDWLKALTYCELYTKLTHIIEP